MTWISYAQNHEDVALMRALRHLPQGFYIDVGAHDPVADSVTKAFYDRGWHGINIEPVAQWFDRLAAQRPRDINLQVAVGASNGQLELHEVEGTGLSTSDEHQAAQYRAEGLAVQTHRFEQLTLDTVCSRHACDREIHFLKIDVEGAERSVLQGIDLRRYRPWVVVIEATRPRSTESTHREWEGLLLSRGYQFVWFDGLNRFYVADERESLRPLLAQPPSVHDDCMHFTERFLRDDVADYAVLLQQSRQAEQEARQALSNVQRSRSWRWTAPLRGALGWWRGLLAPPAPTAPNSPASSTTALASIPGPTSAPSPASSLTPAPEASPPPPSQSPAHFPARPRLALFAPWPPQPSGIADSVAVLVPHLQSHFEVDLIVPWGPQLTGQAEPPFDDSPPGLGSSLAGLESGPRLRRTEWFDRHSDAFDFICHHLGNSLFHTSTLDHLPKHGGTVVVHDLLIADLLWYLQRTAQRPHAWVRALYHSHGWPALVQAGRQGIEATVRHWPCSLDLLRQADGLIFTSHYAQQWWQRLAGPGTAGSLGLVAAAPSATVISLPQAPVADRLGEGWPVQRRAARARLAAMMGTPLAEDDFVIASFGAIDPSKLHEQLISLWPEAAQRLAAQGARAVLVLVGACADPALQAAAQRAGVCVTGHLPEDDFQSVLLAADLAVQLRQHSRGESSGALLRCWASGLPCVINRHGPMAQLPAEVALMLPEAPSHDDIVQAFCALRADAAARQALAQAAMQHLRHHHDPAQVALAHAQVMQVNQARSPRRRRRALLQAWRHLQPLATEDCLSVDVELASRSPRARALEAADPAVMPPTLWVDITAIMVRDLRSGVQRVTRNLLMPLLQRGITGWRVEAVYLNHGRYWVARAHIAALLQVPEPLREGLPADEPVDAASGDVFFGLDLVTDGVHQHESMFRDWSRKGVRLAFFVHDLLPLSHPQWFPPEAVAHFRGWWGTLSRCADVLVCNSDATAQSVRDALQRQPNGPLGLRTPIVQAIGLGAHLPQAADPAQGDPLAHYNGLQEAVLVVGTVEPRKGVDTVLDAMERLWAQGSNNPLVVVGRPGWMVPELAARLQQHPQQGQRLHWLQDASDATLAALYAQCRLLVMASHAEGYGLPVVEALTVGLPVLARDIPVFREIAGPHARYWGAVPATDNGQASGQAACPAPQTDAAALEAALRLALSGPRGPRQPVPMPSWEASLNRLLPLLLGAGAACL
jgi:FkbM family methyltransferase